MTTLTQFTWTDPTTNTDGSPITAGEITGYSIGIRNTAAAGSVIGTYPIVANVSGAAAGSELLTALGTVLAPGSYAAAIQTVGPEVSPFSPEITFTIAAPVPNPPSNFSVA
ncbi:MAG TPA: hypothetical protein VN879_15930 [Candidatus Acidoferrales bacterium]|nr:hypothetical protein [Candidatus Acidoferrales bacterium]